MAWCLRGRIKRAEMNDQPSSLYTQTWTLFWMNVNTIGADARLTFPPPPGNELTDQIWDEEKNIVLRHFWTWKCCVLKRPLTRPLNTLQCRWKGERQKTPGRLLPVWGARQMTARLRVISKQKPHQAWRIVNLINVMYYIITNNVLTTVKVFVNCTEQCEDQNTYTYMVKTQ